MARWLQRRMIFMVGWGYDDMVESIAKVSDNEMDTWNNWVENNGGDVQFGRFVNAEAERRARESKGWTEEDTKDLEELKKWVFDATIFGTSMLGMTMTTTMTSRLFTVLFQDGRRTLTLRKNN